MGTPITPEQQEENNRRLAAEARARRGETEASRGPKYAAPLPADLGPPVNFNAPLPGIAEALHRRAARRVDAMIEAAGTSGQDIAAIYAATRIAARVGADRLPVKRARLRMRSVLPPRPAEPTGAPPASSTSKGDGSA